MTPPSAPGASDAPPLGCGMGTPPAGEAVYPPGYYPYVARFVDPNAPGTIF